MPVGARPQRTRALTIPRDPVVIIGAGPTGLTAALALGLRGVPVVLAEAEPALAHDLRAGSYHPPTIEMLAALGVGEAMHQTGIVVPIWQVRDRIEGVVAEFDLSLLRDETPFPYRLHLEQHRLTPILLDRIRRAVPDVELRFGARIEGFEQDLNGVTVQLSDGPLRASFLIGCDGARSTVRRGLGTAFEGFTWDDRFLVASTTYDLGALGFAGAGYVADPTHWAAVFHVPDEGPPGLWRIAYGIAPEEDEAEALRPDAIQSRLRIVLEHSRAAPTGGAFPLNHASVYKVHQRVAARFATGRVVLAGDAAHVNNPLGGLGLNGGIHDAVNLSEKLSQVFSEGADHAALLDLYDRQRRPINVQAVQAMSIRNKRLLQETDPAIRRERLDELRATAADPARARAYLMNTSMINSVREAAAIA
ncbi:FAD-dependent oxidoreductase [Muricoccus radiodurans]|uniref:FAD-dependent oxidoreductase n=1 Tax=Muricoccus radiodurans TaxID=2231721 RepID=UPI003CE82C56